MKKFKNFRKKHPLGMTLVEILVVVAIIGLLAAIVVVSTSGVRQRARDTKRVSDLKTISSALGLYYINNRAYPTAITPGQALRDASGIVYLKKIPTNVTPRTDGSCTNDDYTYAQIDSKHYTICSCTASAVSDIPGGLITVNQSSAVKAADDTAKGTCWPAKFWTKRSFVAATTAAWNTVSVSANGAVILATAAYQTAGFIYLSSDYGANWTELTDLGSFRWQDVLVSDNGQDMIASAWSGYKIYVSHNGGTSWSLTNQGYYALWGVAAGSPDLHYLILTDGSSGNNYLYTSSDYGDNWTRQDAAGSKDWRYLAMSSDGVKALGTVYGASGYDYLYMSTSSGATMTQLTSLGYLRWANVTMTPNGEKLAAWSYGTTPGYKFWRSLDGGATWSSSTLPYAASVTSLNYSHDGTKLVMGYTSRTYVSANDGDSWTQLTNAPTSSNYDLAISDDGSFMASAVANSYLRTSNNSGATWSQISMATGQPWAGLAAWNNGKNILVGVDKGGYYYTSDDYGATWAKQATTQTGGIIRSSTDGKVIIRVTGTNIDYSTDYGVSWQSSDAPSTPQGWSDFAISANGQKAVAYGIVQGSPAQYCLYTTANGGVNWTQRFCSNYTISGVASADDGDKLVASVKLTSDTQPWIYISNDNGANWSATSKSPYNIGQVYSSGDGNKLISSDASGGIYVSEDRGVTWVRTSTIPGYKITGSADGKRIIFYGYSDHLIHYSGDGGYTWITQPLAPTQYWTDLYASPDGTHFYGIQNSGYLYTSP